MCLISLRSQKHQFLRILGRLNEVYSGGSSSEGMQSDQSLEATVNNIVFGIPPPPRRFDYFGDPSGEGQARPLVKVHLSEVDSGNSNAGQPKPEDAVYFKNENPFDVHNSQFENIWVLI